MVSPKGDNLNNRGWTMSKANGVTHGKANGNGHSPEGVEPLQGPLSVAYPFRRLHQRFKQLYLHPFKFELQWPIKSTA